MTDSIDAIVRYVQAYDDYEKQRDEAQAWAGDVIRCLLSRNGISLRRFAVLLEVSPSFLSKVERGMEPLPPEVARRLLCLYYNREGS